MNTGVPLFRLSEEHDKMRSAIRAVAEKEIARRSAESGAKEGKFGIKGCLTPELLLDPVRIPSDRMIGAPGSGPELRPATRGPRRVTIDAKAVGIAEGAVGYVKEREQLGKRIADFQGIEFHA